MGINTFIVSQSGGNEGLGFAVPSATIRTVFRQLKQYGTVRRQEVGASFQTITSGMAMGLGLVRNYGVIVSDVWPRGPAETAGLKVGDILVSMDGQPVDNLPTVIYNFRLRESTEKVKMVVQRGGKEASASRPSRSAASSTPCRPWPTRSRTLCRSSVSSVSKSIAHRRGRDGLRDPFGVIVVARAAGATTEVPLQPRDVIRSVNTRHYVAAGLRDAVRALKAGIPVTLQIQRDGRLMYVSFTLD